MYLKSVLTEIKFKQVATGLKDNGRCNSVSLTN